MLAESEEIPPLTGHRLQGFPIDVIAQVPAQLT